MLAELLTNLSAISNIATMLAVIVAAYQLYLLHKQSVTNFEDDFAKEYRELASKLPIKAFLGDAFSNADIKKHLDEMYHYFDLCNEQAFHFKSGRISRKTWNFWLDGISSNMCRPAFSRAWNVVASRSNNDFSELRELFPPNISDVSNVIIDK